MRKSLAEFDSAKIQNPEGVIGGGRKSCCCDQEPPKHKKRHGNNGFGNGGGDPAPGNSGHNKSHNSGQKLDDIVR